jgi:hypothetical protein
MAVTITSGGTTFTFNDGDVKKITSSIGSKAEQQEIASTGPLQTYLYDYDGCLKTITISGYLTPASSTRVSGYSIDAIVEQKQWLESLVNGAQTTITFVSDFESLSVLGSTSPTAPYKGSFGYTTGMIQDMSFTQSEGDPNRLQFSITILVGT